MVLTIRWPTTVTSNSNYSHQIQITHIKFKLLTSNSNRSHQIQIVTSIGQRLSQWMLSPVFTRSSTIPPFCTIVLWLDTSSLIWSILANMYCTNCGSDVGNCKFCRTCGKGKRNVEHVLFYVRVLLGATTECRVTSDHLFHSLLKSVV